MVMIGGVEGQHSRLDPEAEAAEVEERFFQRELADHQCFDDEPRSATNKDRLYHRCPLNIFVCGEGRRGVDRDMEIVKSRDECVGGVLYSLLRYIGGCTPSVVPFVLSLLAPSLLRLLLRWDGGDHKRGSAIGDWYNVRGKPVFLFMLLLPVVSSMSEGLCMSGQEAGAGAHRSRLINRRDLEVDG